MEKSGTADILSTLCWNWPSVPTLISLEQSEVTDSTTSYFFISHWRNFTWEQFQRVSAMKQIFQCVFGRENSEQLTLVHPLGCCSAKQVKLAWMDLFSTPQPLSDNKRHFLGLSRLQVSFRFILWHCRLSLLITGPEDTSSGGRFIGQGWGSTRECGWRLYPQYFSALRQPTFQPVASSYSPLSTNSRAYQAKMFGHSVSAVLAEGCYNWTTTSPSGNFRRLQADWVGVGGGGAKVGSLYPRLEVWVNWTEVFRRSCSQTVKKAPS